MTRAYASEAIKDRHRPFKRIKEWGQYPPGVPISVSKYLRTKGGATPSEAESDVWVRIPRKVLETGLVQTQLLTEYANMVWLNSM
jgi:hypothetical protein